MKILLTGAAGGLGRAFACECAERGFDILLTDIKEDALKIISDGIRVQFADKNIRVYEFACDITDKTEVEKLFCFASEKNMLPDILLNIAGVDFEGCFDKLDSEKVSMIIGTNILGTMNVTHCELNKRITDKELYILFVSSFAAKQPMPLNATYAASKRYLLDFSIALGEELKNEKVYTMALCPSGMPTNAQCLKAIDAQGFWGRVTTVRLNDVTKKSIDRLMKKKSVYIPGGANKFISLILKFTTPRCAAHYVCKRWEKSLKTRKLT